MQQTYQTSMAIHVLMDVHDPVLMVPDGYVGTNPSPSESVHLPTNLKDCIFRFQQGV